MTQEDQQRRGNGRTPDPPGLLEWHAVRLNQFPAPQSRGTRSRFGIVPVALSALVDAAPLLKEERLATAFVGIHGNDRRAPLNKSVQRHLGSENPLGVRVIVRGKCRYGKLQEDECRKKFHFRAT